MHRYIRVIIVIIAFSAAHMNVCSGASDNETSQKNTAKTSLTIEAGDSSVDKHIEYPDFLEKLGDLHREGKFAELVEYGEELLRKNTNDLSVYFFLGLAYYHTGKKERALEVFNTGLQSDYMGLPGTFGEKAAIFDKAVIHYRMHEIYTELGNDILAREHLKKAKELMKQSRGEDYDEAKMMTLFCRHPIKYAKPKRCITYKNGTCDDTACGPTSMGVAGDLCE